MKDLLEEITKEAESIVEYAKDEYVQYSAEKIIELIRKFEYKITMQELMEG